MKIKVKYGKKHILIALWAGVILGAASAHILNPNSKIHNEQLIAALDAHAKKIEKEEDDKAKDFFR